MAERVVVVGAGVGGLACALRLAHAGCDVTVLERASAPGGKMRQVGAGGMAMDAGPTVFTMRWVFDELFAEVGEQFDDHVRLRPATTLARHAWSEREQLDLFTDIDRSADAIAAFSSPAEARRYREFCARARSVYDTLERPYLRGSRPNPLSLAQRAGLRGLPGLARIAPFSTLWRALGQHFHDERLRQLFGRYATYCGSSPFESPATLMLVAHVEREGVWLVEGGMHRLALALASAASRRGAQLRYGCEVRRLVLRDGKVAGVLTAAGESIVADAVVFNGDAQALPAGLLGDDFRGAAAPYEASSRSLSAITWNLRARTEGFALLRHNVFFSRDYPREFSELLQRRQLPSDPTVYICAQDRGDTASPLAAERLLCLVNAPADGDARTLTAQEIASCEHHMRQTLSRCGLQIDWPAATVVRTTPSDFAQLFPGSGGALYGRASHGWKASFQRPGARTSIPGLYLAGGTTHPGPGVPMAALSGRQAAMSLLAERPARIRVSMPGSPPVATPGGTSMR